MTGWTCLIPVLIATLGATHAPVNNPGFEQLGDDGPPIGWRHGQHDAEYTHAVIAAEGNHFIRITGQSNEGRAYWGQTLPRGPVPFGIRVKLRYRGDSHQMDGFVRYRDLADNAAELARPDWKLPTPQADWTDFTFNYVTPDEVLAKPETALEVLIYCRGKGQGDYDDFRIDLLDAADVAELKAAEAEREAAEAWRWEVPNGDFESLDDEGNLTGWRPGSAGGGDYTHESIVEDGSRFGRITGKSAEGRAWFNQSTAERQAPKAFKVSFRYRGTGKPVPGFVRLRDADDAATELSVHRWSLPAAKETWQTFEQAFAVPEPALKARAVRPEITLYLYGVGRLDYDDFQLETLDRFEPGWPLAENPREMPWRPQAKMVCQQNPPDFSWPPVPFADGYQLQVCGDEQCQRVVRQTEILTVNYHNFPKALAPDTYWWRVRFKSGENWGRWSDARRFRVASDAQPFEVPPVAELAAAVPPGHPRVWATAKTLEAFRARGAEGGPRAAWLAAEVAGARSYAAQPLPPEPTFDPQAERNTAAWIAAHNKLRGEGEGPAERVLRTAFAYLATGDEELGQSAVAQLVNVAGWDPDGATGYQTHDQVHRALTWKPALAYDWCYDLLTPEQRQLVCTMVQQRAQTMLDHLVTARPIWEQPYDSHGWTAFGYLGITAIALLHDVPVAADWFGTIVPAYANVLPPWGDEDGGWCQGTAYWQYSQGSNKEFMDVLLSATGLNLYDKAYARNSGYFPLYTLPHGSPRSHFGDGNRDQPSDYHRLHYRRVAQMTGNPIYQWAWQMLGDRLPGGLRSYYSGDDDLPARPPVDLPQSRWFRDIDWVTMHSDLTDPERVSLYFKSSPMGSFNHSHADQNCFVLNAFGEALAIDSGYYDWYGSPHDAKYTRQTLAHCAITHDGGLGQPIFDIEAQGHVTGFVTGPQLDACTGDATPGYKGKLGRAVRHILYLRPATFIVIDELAAAAGTKSTFEWWLQALDELKLDDDQAGAVIQQGQAQLKVRLLTPTGLTAHSRREFIGPPNVYAEGETPVAVRPQGRGDQWLDQTHAWFATPPVERTTIVATLQATRQGEAPAALQSERQGDVLVLHGANGDRVWIRLSESGLVQAGDVSFDGAAVARRGDTWLLVQGTKLSVGGTNLVESAQPVTVETAPGQAMVSCGDDAEVTLHQPGVTRVRDRAEHEFDRNRWRVAGEQLVLRLEPGAWPLWFNDTPTPGPLPEVSLPVRTAAGEQTVKLAAMRGVDGSRLAWGKLPVPAGLYRIEQRPEGLQLGATGADDPVVWLGADEPLLLRGAAGPLVLPAATTGGPLAATAGPLEAAQAKCLLRVEAETFTGAGGGTPSRYSHRKFLSGGVGVGNWESPGMWVSWSLDVPAAGKYDLVLAGATHTGTRRALSLGSRMVEFTAAQTGGYGASPDEWLALAIPLAVDLQKGPTTLRIWCAEGLLNLDWLGLAPAGK